VLKGRVETIPVGVGCQGLTREFRAKVTAAGNEVMAADWRAGACNDPVPALAIAACLGGYAVMGLRVRW
jgi:hypothetical protein